MSVPMSRNEKSSDDSAQTPDEKEKDNMAAIVVTGGAGFLGSHLCDRLIARGDDVLCVDNFFTGCKANIAHLLGLTILSHQLRHW